MFNYKLIESLFPEILKTSEDYNALIRLLYLVLESYYKYTNEFCNLVDVDSCDEKFLPLLANLLGYTNYRYDLSSEINRNLIKNIFNIYKMRGTEESILNMVSYFNNPNYLGGNLWVPGSDIPSHYNYITYPYDNLFRLNSSAVSGTSKFPDTYNTDGTMIINVEYINDELRKKIREVIPAGIKFFLVNICHLGSNDGSIIKYPYKVLDDDSTIIIESECPRAKTANGLSKRANMILSGKSMIHSNYELSLKTFHTWSRSPDFSTGLYSEVEFSSVDYQASVEVSQLIGELPKLSNNLELSSKLRLQGLPSHNYELEYTRNLELSNLPHMYRLSELNHITIKNPLVKYHSSLVEINKGKIEMSMVKFRRHYTSPLLKITEYEDEPITELEDVDTQFLEVECIRDKSNN